MSLNVGAGADMNADANVVAQPGVGMGVKFSTHYEIECYGEDGVLKWLEEFDNLVVNAGLNDLLDKTFKGSGYTAAWYVGLADGTPTFASGDTMASHAGWVEVAAYSEATRPALTLGSVSGQSVSNTASKAEFTVDEAATVIGGAFIASNNTVGGTTGTLYGGGAFASDRTLEIGDLLRVTATLTAAAA